MVSYQIIIVKLVLLIAYVSMQLFISGCNAGVVQNPIPSASISNQEYAWTHFNKGLAYEQVGAWEESVYHFHTAISFDPEQPRMYLHLGRNLAAMGYPELAISHLVKAENLAHASDYLLYFDMGRIYQILGETETAKKMYQTSLDIYPEFLQGRAALASLSLVPIVTMPVLPPQ